MTKRQVNKAKNMHSLRRMSAFGEPSVGFCTKCGKQNLTPKDLLIDECENPMNEDPDQTLLNAIKEAS